MMPKLTELDDIALLDLIKESDHMAAFRELYDRHWETVYDIACKKLPQEEAARDLVHDLFVDLWTKRHRITISASFTGYLYSMLQNRFIDARRKEASHRKLEEEIRTGRKNSGDDLFEVVASKDMEHQLLLEVENMPAAMRRIFLLSRKEHLSTHEIANRLSISNQTVKNQISKALSRLRQVTNF